MAHILSIAQYLAMITASIVFVAFLIAGNLYLKAYKEMKRTKIIGSLMWLLYAISAKFLFVVISFMMVWAQDLQLQTFNAIQSIPNILLIFAIMNFVHRSIATPTHTKKAFEKLDKKDVRKS